MGHDILGHGQGKEKEMSVRVVYNRYPEEEGDQEQS
jgi:hypothetical protein